MLLTLPCWEAGGHELFRVATGMTTGLTCHMRSISLEKVQPRCEPPWGEWRKTASVVSRAYKVSISQLLVASPPGSFTSLPPLRNHHVAGRKIRETFHDPYLFDAESKHVSKCVPTLPETLTVVFVCPAQAVSVSRLLAS